MINEIISMNGYGVYVWSAFSFTLIGFAVLYLVIKVQLVKEQSKFNSKFASLTSEKIIIAKKQATIRKILANTSVANI